MQITFREGNTETALKKWVGVGIGNHAQIFTAELLNKMSEHSIHHFPLKLKDFSQKQFDLVTEISFLFFSAICHFSSSSKISTQWKLFPKYKYFVGRSSFFRFS
jgi:hypothetical protein